VWSRGTVGLSLLHWDLFTLDIDTYGDHFALGGHVRWSVGQTQFRLQCVEVGLQLGFLFDTWGLVLPAVSSVFLQFPLDAGQRVVGLAALQPGHGPPDPLQQLKHI